MALGTQDVLEISIKHAQALLDVVKAYSEYNHHVSTHERTRLHDLVAIMTQARDIAITTARQIDDEHRWNRK